MSAYLALLLGYIIDGIPANETRLHKSVNGNTLQPMIELLVEFSALHREVPSLGSDSALDDELFDSAEEGSSSTSLEAKTPSSQPEGTMSLDMPMSLDLDPLPVLDEVATPLKSTITFLGSKDSDESAKSFMKIIQVLKDVESRLSK